MNRSSSLPHRVSLSSIALTALLLLSLAGCAGGGTTNKLLLDHSGGSQNSPYRHHNG